MSIKATKGTYHVPQFYLPTPSLLINRHLEGGGIASGSIVQIASKNPGAFKTSFCAQMMGYAQAMGYDVAYVDAEAALDLSMKDGAVHNQWFSNLGVDASQVWYVESGPGEEIWEAIYDLVENKNVKVIVMDSIHAVQPTKMLETELGAHTIGQHAMLHTRGLLKLLPILKKNDAILIGINHMKVNMTQQGAMGHKGTGGSAWGFYSKYIFEMNRSTSKSKLEGETMIPVEIYIQKSKGGVSYVQVETFAEQGRGISSDHELAALAIVKGLAIKKGGWYRDKEGNVIGQGSDALAEWAAMNQELIMKDETVSVDKPE